MQKILGFFISRWFLSLIGVAVLAALVWFFGPFVAVLAGIVVRLAIILLLLLVWLGVNLWLDRRRRQRDAALAAGVAAATPDANAGAEEVAALSDRLKTSLALLRKARGTKGYIYEQPWYVIIGPPGAGKTTALLNAGLKFPLAAEMGQGRGGRRRWHPAVRLVVHRGRGADRHRRALHHAGFRCPGRPRRLGRLPRPLEADPGAAGAERRDRGDLAGRHRRGAARGAPGAHARSIRKRVKEITERLGLRLPVYALLTKADLLAGFTEFFDDLDAERRGQVWGTTFAADADRQAGPVARFAPEFALLVKQLEDRMLDRLAAERSPERRAMIVGFPTQVASLEAPLTEFLTEAFGGSTLDPAPFLRGVYMTSGTQEGTPIDRLTGALSRSFGIDQRRAPSLRAASGRSYFLTRLLSDVIFNEAMLASDNPQAVRRRRTLQTAGFAAVALVFLALLAGLVLSRGHNAAAIAASNQALNGYAGTAKALPLNPLSDANLLSILPMLDQAAGPAVRRRRPGHPWRDGLRAEPGAEARRRGQHALSKRARQRDAAAADPATGSGNAWRLRPARLPLSSDPRLFDAGRPGAARQAAGAGLDGAGLAAAVSGPCRAAGAGRPDGAFCRRCWRHPCPRCRWTAPWSRRRGRRSAGFPWRTGSIRASAARPRRRKCRPGCRATPWVRPAPGCSRGHPASR